jgi:biotin transporter BioY
VSALWAGLAALNVTIAETLFKSYEGYRLAYVPQALLTNWLIYRLIRSSPTILDALVLFSMGTMVLRIGATLCVLRQTVSPGTWCAVGLVTLANVVRVTWK